MVVKYGICMDIYYSLYFFFTVISSNIQIFSMYNKKYKYKNLYNIFIIARCGRRNNNFAKYHTDRQTEREVGNP